LNELTEQISEYYRYEDINYTIVALLRGARKFYSDSPTVLDVGCGRGRLGLEIEQLGFKLTGLDNSPVACRVARERITEVIELDLTDYRAVEKRLKDRQFDCLMVADCLEHCADPYAVLSFYRRFLKPNGSLALSLPNVLVWDNRLRMLFGKFNYADSGVMDRTHLRFFTFHSARQLVVDCGFVPEKATCEPGIVRAFLPFIKRVMQNGEQSPGAILDSKPYIFYRLYLMPIERTFAAIAPGLLGFRTVMLARVTSSSETLASRRNQN
jgi:2-polyprenyl-3-methyl-5-hydroxy-6-metoxy-1,4-benzoquinol methylase